MTSFASQRSSKGRSFSFRSLRTRPKRASSANAGDDDEPSDADYPYVWALRKTSVLDWEKDVPDADARRAEVKRMFARCPSTSCPARSTWATPSARATSRVCSRSISRTCSTPRRGGAAPAAAYAAGIETLVLEARDEPGYPMLANHLDAARAFLAKARRGGGAVLVHCVQGLNRSGVLVAADLMLEERRSVLDAVRHCRARRGNECVSNKTFQRDLVDLAARTCSAAAGAGRRRAQEAPPRPAAPAAEPPPRRAPSRRRSTSLWGRLMRASSRAG
ncbi:phosphatase [Aureococcus anophagefferens]|nr:phosphatase [Aureococcus anophagefferens]